MGGMHCLFVDVEFASCSVDALAQRIQCHSHKLCAFWSDSETASLWPKTGTLLKKLHIGRMSPHLFGSFESQMGVDWTLKLRLSSIDSGPLSKKARLNGNCYPQRTRGMDTASVSSLTRVYGFPEKNDQADLDAVCLDSQHSSPFAAPCF